MPALSMTVRRGGALTMAEMRETKLFIKWSCDDVEVVTMSLQVYISVKDKYAKYAVSPAVNNLMHTYFYDLRAFIAGTTNVAPFQETRFAAE